MKYGVNLPNMTDPVTLVDLAVTAEAAGWDGVFLWDHLVYADTVDLPVMDPWVVLGAIAGATKRVRLGTMITPIARRRPWHVAKEVATLDHLSAGRAVLGVGLGWPALEDFARFGDRSDDRLRAEMLDEGLDLIDELWSGERVRFDGDHFQVEATMQPPPVQQPRPPVWIAGMWPNRRPFERAARWDGVVPRAAAAEDGPPLLRPDDVRAVLAEIARHRVTTGAFDVVVNAHWEHTAAEYEDAGVTWLITSWDAEPGWVDQLRPRIEQGPA
jgi:alkanesulfonate monooxygenase SsuD/methylene tetrahydromethanopterin reductase-like flavin-dependent oxidoreductase (luciferase family)